LPLLPYGVRKNRKLALSGICTNNPELARNLDSKLERKLEPAVRIELTTHLLITNFLQGPAAARTST
jgi:hypothetical protein